MNIRWPLLTKYLAIQSVFWMIADLFLVFIVQLFNNIYNAAHDLPDSSNLAFNICLTVFFGLVQGIIFGFADKIVSIRFINTLPLGYTLLYKGVLNFLSSALILFITRQFIFPTFPELIYNRRFVNIDYAWLQIFKLVLTYNFAMAMLISFINQVNRKFGRSMMLSFILGKYRVPKEEDRIFMFLDLKSSTTIAEKLGHIKYSAFIRDFFMDINFVVSKYNVQIYQYVGDEIVLTWDTEVGITNNACINFFFDCEHAINDRKKYYLDRYGLLPVFKAGVHAGIVTAVEIGDIKRDIAYHGDVMNTTARLQSICNSYSKKILISDSLLQKLDTQNFKFDHLGSVTLKGKQNLTEVISVEVKN
ncbi:MAG: adenylate/guanylate cyclase domain-containing protein [Thalassobius sp.]|nr:adenylate/guanylate cyclase domain-containing protein [Thalassovita sp.]